VRRLVRVRPVRHQPAPRARLRRGVPGDRPGAIKLGQTLATRPDSSATKPRTTCSRCRTACRRSRSKRSAKEIERSFERPIGDVFAEIDPVPVGSASIAQVHAA
jgi:ubiquinone biosynthesis protein